MTGGVKESRVCQPQCVFGEEGKIGLGEKLQGHLLWKTILRTIALFKNYDWHSSRNIE